jgi:hypothetical protein
MSTLKLVTWNTLYRYHEEKYVPDSYVLKAYPFEKDRIRDQVVTIREILASHSNTILCLQEVPGDLLSELKIAFGTKYHVCEYKHVRTPQPIPSISTENLYTDADEYLCTLIPKLFYPEIQTSAVQYSTTGKAALISICDKDLTVINTHATIKQQGIDDVVDVCKNNLELSTRTFLLGDCNNILPDILKSFERAGMFTSMYLSHGLTKLHTYPRGNRSIDHIIGFGLIESKSVIYKIIETGSLSDHLAASIEF